MRFADELRGSAGERCRVIDVGLEDLVAFGVIEDTEDLESVGKVHVRYDDGTHKDVPYTLVRLLTEETP